MADQSAVLLIVISLIAAIPFHDLFSSCVYLYSYPLPWLTGRLPKQLFVRQLPPQPISSADQSAALMNCILLGSHPLLWLTNYLQGNCHSTDSMADWSAAQTIMCWAAAPSMNSMADRSAALMNCILLGSRPLQWLTNYLWGGCPLYQFHG